MCGGFHKRCTAWTCGFAKDLRQGRRFIFLQRKVNLGEGDHFPAVLTRTFKHCLHRLKSQETNLVRFFKWFNPIIHVISFEKMCFQAFYQCHLVNVNSIDYISFYILGNTYVLCIIQKKLLQICYMCCHLLIIHCLSNRTKL